MTTKSNAERYGIALLILVVAIASISVVRLAYSLGLSAGKAEAENACSQGLILIGGEIEALKQKLRTYETGLAREIQFDDIQLEKENDDAKQENSRRLADVRSGAVRLSIRSKAATCTASSPGDADSSAVAHHQEARTELDPATAESLVAITQDGDAAIRDLNACVDRYNTARRYLTAFEAVNAPVLP